ncbi:hypothetical protein M409DRAFT_66528 [Zasmidium cellare ATCC 36951]|uniref:NAD(P)-binding protein n=1 Tax=Zasmidium cellare ATCC 36951 TaxID=1080233 RepID=A0A6A6CGV9_ZASCE|nr:uncharacterized protein M409DRAFT_66528 [Zasmidium cellare ATCC 36951]KAF2166477.1 hypothetical protein M409DRAFT_66528 [Zasmidium cellare ATCC 36951]
MPPSNNPYQPYADAHKNPKGPGDARPTALQIIGDCNAAGKLVGKTVVITGCSGGIGQHVAAAMYETGAQLYLIARNMPKLEKVINDIVSHSSSKGYPRPIAIEMHLDNLVSVKAGAQVIKSLTDKVDVLINNAGMSGAPLSKTVDGFEIHMGTNHFAHFLLFHELQPFLEHTAKKSGTTSRIVTVASSSHMLSGIRRDDYNYEKHPEEYTKMEAYGQSKTANIYMSNAIARHFSTQGLTGLAVHPGSVFEGSEFARNLTEEGFAAFGGEEVLQKLKPLFKNAEQGAATVVWAAVSFYFDDVTKGGKYLADVGEGIPQAAGATDEGPGYAPHAFDKEGEDWLWKESVKYVVQT